MSVADLQQGVQRAVSALPFETLRIAADALQESTSELLEATKGSDDGTLERAAADQQRCAEEIARVADLCEQVRKTCDNYLTSIGAASSSTAPDTPVKPTTIPGPFGEPLHPHLEEHVFRGHIRYKQFTGYHSRPGGADQGSITIGEPEAPDTDGCYRAPATATTRSGRVKTIRKTFFPDHWAIEEVRQAIRTAFRSRRPVHDSDGAVMPGVWQGTYRSVTIEGKLFSGTNFDTATLDDVGTAYPLVAKQPERPET